jgi:hypothetical protein
MVTRATGGLLPLDAILPVARGGWLLGAVIIACVLLTRSQWIDFWLLPAIIVAMLGVHLVTISSHRFALPVLPVVFILIGGMLGRLVGRLTRAGALAVVVLTLAAAAMQSRQWAVVYRLDASELDGAAAENRREADGRFVRFSDAARGRRVAFALYDEYLPAGPLTLRVLARRGQASLPAQSPIVRVRLFSLEGSAPCEMSLTVDQLSPADSWTHIALPCSLPHDGLARLIGETLGRVDLSFSDIITLQWRPAS